MRRNRSKKRLCNLYRLKFVFISCNGFHKLIILSAMHKVCGLDDKILYAVCNCSVKSLLYVVNLFSVTSLDVVDDDLSCECSSY